MSELANWEGRRLHFVGIGGVGMSGLALAAHAIGASVTGSDVAERPSMRRLRESGIAASVGHAAANVPAGAEVVYSSAVNRVNPERERGRELGLQELRRGELLGEISRLRNCVAVSGTYGKTTTAAMIVHALRGAGERPGYVIGGYPRATSSSADWGEGPWLVVEADESDRSFLALDTNVVVVTNVELEHHREYDSFLDLERAFRSFLARAPQAVVWDRPELLALREGPVVPFDVRDLRLDRDGSRFTWRGLEVRVGVLGEHNARNAAAALEACRLIGADAARAAAALADFPGVERRFEQRGSTPGGALVYEDYVAHPTEVQASLDAARTLEPERLVAVLQPFQHIRVQQMGRQLAEALAAADAVIVLETYATRGRPEDYPGSSARQIAITAGGLGGGRNAVWMPDVDAAARYLRNELRAGDLCVALGSGDIPELAKRLVSPQSRQSAKGSAG